MDPIAAAGGTGHALTVASTGNVNQELQAAMATVRAMVDAAWPVSQL